MYRCMALTLFVAAATGLQLAPKPASAIEGEYLLQLHTNATASQHAALAARVNGKKFTIGADFRAIHAALSPAEVAWVLGQGHLVAHVDYNMVVTARQTCNAGQTEPVSWGQVRTTAESPADTNQVYAHNPAWGQGVDSYVVDSGVDCDHEEFVGRCIFGANFAGGSNGDGNGHGTHCAGTTAGTTYGLAKAATVIAVKVLADNGGGTIAGIIEGLEWVATQRTVRNRPAVLNLSLGGGKNPTFDNAVTGVVNSGVHVAIASGNDNRDACLFSPVSPVALMVASTELGNQGGASVDSRSSFSNFGTCIDIFAPGSSIISATPNNNYAVYSGTSMAAPHVAGALLIHLTTNPTHTPAQAKAALLQTAMSTDIRNRGTGSPDAMLHAQC